MKKKTKSTLLSIVLILAILSTFLIMLALSTLPGIAQSEDDGYPAPADFGYPVDAGYPVYDPYPVIGYPVEIVSEPTKLQAEITEIIANVQPKEKSKTYQAWQQLKIIVKYYYGKVRLQWR